MARIFLLFLIFSLMLPAAASWAQDLTQSDYELLGIKPPTPGFVDVIGVPDLQKVPAGTFPQGMAVVDAGLACPGGLLIVTLRVPAERADEARKLMLDSTVVNSLIDNARERSRPGSIEPDRLVPRVRLSGPDRRQAMAGSRRTTAR